MGAPRRKLLKPVAVATGVKSGRSLEAFVDYLRSECHLAENTVAAYGRDLKRFFVWLEGRSIAKLTIRELADYAGWLHEHKLAPASIARHLVSLKIFLPLSATRRAAAREPGGTAGQPETVGARAARDRAGHDRQAAGKPRPVRRPLAARPGAVGAAVRHRLPGLGTLEPEAMRRAPGRRLLQVPGQGGQRADRAAGPPGDPGRARLSGARAARARGAAQQPAVAVAIAARAAAAARADLGAVQANTPSGSASPRT